MIPKKEEKEKLLEAIAADPFKSYLKGPKDVVRDRRLNARRKLEVLRKWELLIRDGVPGAGNDSTLAAIEDARRAISERQQTEAGSS